VGRSHCPDESEARTARGLPES